MYGKEWQRRNVFAAQETVSLPVRARSVQTLFCMSGLRWIRGGLPGLPADAYIPVSETCTQNRG